MCLATSLPRFSKQYSIEITRLASIQNTVVIGGAGRLFAYMLKLKKPKSVVSYCDLRYGTGNVYDQLGFSKIGKPTIGYEYVDLTNNNVRKNRLHYQKHKLPNFSGQSTKCYLASNGLERLYNCGHQKYVFFTGEKP